MTVLEFTRLLRAHWLFLLAMVTAGVAVMFVYTLRQPVLYAASSTGLVKVGNATSVGEESGNLSLAQEKSEIYSSLVSTVPVAERVVEELDLDLPPEAVVGRFSSTVDANGTLLRITATGTTPEEARDLANAVVEALAAEAKELENSGLPEGAPPIDLVRVVPLEEAGLPGAPYTPNYQKNLLMGAAGGLVLGLGVLLVRRSVDRRVRSVGDVEESLGASVVGIIPKADNLAKAHRGVREDLGIAAESFRQLRTNLRFIDVDSPPRRIVITSALPGEGKSTVSGNLARLVAHAGQPVVLVDADLRRPTLADTWGLDTAVGLTQVLAGDLAVSDALVSSGRDDLFLLPAGRLPPNPSELLGSQRMRQLIDELARTHLVILDAPPLLPVTDAGLLAGMCDGAIVVVAAGKTNTEQTAQCRRILDQVGARVLGTVLNMTPTKGADAYGGYGYGGYGYGYRQESKAREQYSRMPGRRKAG